MLEFELSILKKAINMMKYYIYICLSYKENLIIIFYSNNLFHLMNFLFAQKYVYYIIKNIIGLFKLL